MPQVIELDPVDRVRVTILIDNVTDPLIPDHGPVTRLSWPKALAGGAPRVVTPLVPDGVPDALIAEPDTPAAFTAAVRTLQTIEEKLTRKPTGSR